MRQLEEEVERKNERLRAKQQRVQELQWALTSEQAQRELITKGQNLFNKYRANIVDEKNNKKINKNVIHLNIHTPQQLIHIQFFFTFIYWVKGIFISEFSSQPFNTNLISCACAFVCMHA